MTMRRTRPYFSSRTWGSHRLARNIAKAIIGFIPALGAAAGLSPELLVSLNRLSEPAVSNSGDKVVYSLRETDLEANRGRTDLWLLDLDQVDEPRRLTTHAENDSQARWHAGDDWVYFLSGRSGTSQVWRLSLGGGDPVAVTEFPLDIGGFLLAPDGANIVFTAAIWPECGADFECSYERQQKAADASASGRLYEKLFVRHWDNWKDGRRRTLFSQQLDEDGNPSGDVVLLNSGLDADVPSVPFGDMDEVAISPDGERVVFSARMADAGEAWSTNFDLFEVSIRGGRLRNLTESNPAWDTAPQFSPDGESLYWLAMSRPGFEADQFSIRELSLKGGKTRDLAPQWDHSPQAIRINPNGSRLYAIASDRGEQRLYEVALRADEIKPLTANGHVSAVVPARDGPIIVLDSLRQPADLYQIRDNERGPYRLTHVNATALEGIQFGVYEQFSFAGWNDETVFGYVMQPVSVEPDRRYPVAFLIHGGPQGSFDDHFHYRWNPQTYAAEGYAVVFVDFHGSTGYGQAFTDAISNDWGGKPLEDLRKGLSAALEKYPWLDGDKACALGASYGGYMVNWIAGNWSEPFKCLVNHDGVFDTRMMYYSTEELWFPEWDHGGPYFDVPNNHERYNPANFVAAWDTPMLVIHGALDYRVPETQGIAAFTALQRKGIPSKFLYFPDENHWVRKPANSIQWHNTVHDWLARYLK